MGILLKKASPAWSPRVEELYKACSGTDCRSVAQSGVLRGLRVQLSDGLDRTMHRADLCASDPFTVAQLPRRIEAGIVSSAAGRLCRLPTIQKIGGLLRGDRIVV
jgi:hypothetical protein